MMNTAFVYYKGEWAGVLIQIENGSYLFRYLDKWIEGSQYPSISLTLPKSQQDFISDHLFPFFYNMLPEGANKQMVCTKMKIDEDDHFGLLITTASYDTIGAVTVIKTNNII
jgi:HipA-like protein